MLYSVPYTRSLSGVGYRKSRVDPRDLGSWGTFANPRHRGRMIMHNDLREVLGAALKSLGHSLNSVDDDELEVTGAVVKRWKANIREFMDDQGKLGIQIGDAVACQSYSGDVILAMEDDPDIGYHTPREGASLVADDFAIPAGAVNRDLAHAFINHMRDPDNAARNMAGIHYRMLIPAACKVIRDLGPDNGKYERRARVMETE